jgi:hypothetical protein
MILLGTGYLLCSLCFPRNAVPSSRLYKAIDLNMPLALATFPPFCFGASDWY